jgi:beta-phosphoglucomutase-like phosphatase (HAD superfamily)
MTPNEFGKLKLAFFDIDGTLIRRDFQPGNLSLKSRAFNYATETVFGLKGFDYTQILGKRIFGLTDRSILKTTLLGIGIKESEYQAKEDELFLAIDDYFERHVNSETETGYYPLPKIKEFLEKLKAAGIQMGLVTGNIKKHTDWKLKICGLEEYFTTGGFGEDAEHRTDIMRVGIRRNPDIQLDSFCHFGDSPPDLMAARECQIKAVAITDLGGGTHFREELEEINYGLVIDSWSEINAIAKYLSSDCQQPKT